MTRTVRIRVLLAAVAFVALIAIVLLFRPAPITVEVGTVDRGPLQSTVEALGFTRVHERYIVSATVAGRLGRVDFFENDPVTRGEVLARIEPLAVLALMSADEAHLREIQATVDAAEADQRAAQSHLMDTRSQFAQALRDRKRAHELYSGGYIPLADRERADVAYTTAQANAASAAQAAKAADARVADALQGIEPTQADLKRLQVDANRTVLRSPVDGRVLRVIQKSEQFVAAGTPVIEIGNPNSIDLVIQLLSTDAIDVRPGQSISIDDGSGTWRYTGRVRYVEPSGFTKISALGVEEQRVNVIGDFTGPHAGFRDAFRIDGRIAVWRSLDVLRVPVGALFRCESDWCVYTVARGKARLARIDVDHIGDTAARVLKGLEAGDEVVLHPSDKIGDGTAVHAIQVQSGTGLQTTNKVPVGL